MMEVSVVPLQVVNVSVAVCQAGSGGGGRGWMMCMRFYTMTPAAMSRNGARTLTLDRRSLRTSALSLLN